MKSIKFLWGLGFILLVLNVYLLIEHKKPSCADAQTCIPLSTAAPGTLCGTGWTKFPASGVLCDTHDPKFNCPSGYQSILMVTFEPGNDMFSCVKQ